MNSLVPGLESDSGNEEALVGGYIRTSRFRKSRDSRLWGRDSFQGFWVCTGISRQGSLARVPKDGDRGGVLIESIWNPYLVSRWKEHVPDRLHVLSWDLVIGGSYPQV